MSSNSYASAERRTQNDQYDKLRDLINVFYPANARNFALLSHSAFNRLSSVERFREISRVTTAFNSPW